MLTGVKARLTASDWAREPRSLALVAYYDGYARAAYPGRDRSAWHEYPRCLTTEEARFWRDGFAEGQSERRRHEAHGFASCESVTCEGVHP